MAKKRQWFWAPDRRLKPTVPYEVKAEVQRKVDELIEKHLKPELVKPAPKNREWNNLTGIHTKWHKSFLYFVGNCASPGPHRISPTFEFPSLAWNTRGTAHSTWPTCGTPGDGGKCTRG